MSKRNRVEIYVETARREEICEDWVARFNGRKAFVKDSAKTHEVIDPTTRKPTYLASLVAHLSSEYLRLTDVVTEFRKKLDMGDPYVDRLALAAATIERDEVISKLVQTLAYARAHNFLDESIGEELQVLEKRNLELKRRVEELSEKLKKCEEDFREFKSRVHPLEGDVEYDPS